MGARAGGRHADRGVSAGVSPEEDTKCAGRGRAGSRSLPAGGDSLAELQMGTRISPKAEGGERLPGHTSICEAEM